MDAERPITFEEINIAVENTTQAQKNKITSLGQELEWAKKQQ